LRKALIVLGIVAYQVAAHVLLAVDSSGGALPALLGGVPHAAAYLFMLWFFGRTLKRGSEAFITRLARQLDGPLSPAVEAYTRRLTWVWCAFFAAQLAASALLLAFGTIEAWSLFINVLDLPLVALLFIADYVYRVLRFRGAPQASIVAVVRAYARDRLSGSRAR
jgi:uncharacterized membrane protein